MSLSAATTIAASALGSTSPYMKAYTYLKNFVPVEWSAKVGIAHWQFTFIAAFLLVSHNPPSPIITHEKKATRLNFQFLPSAHRLVLDLTLLIARLRSSSTSSSVASAVPPPSSRRKRFFRP